MVRHSSVILNCFKCCNTSLLLSGCPHKGSSVSSIRKLLAVKNDTENRGERQRWSAGIQAWLLVLLMDTSRFCFSTKCKKLCD